MTKRKEKNTFLEETYYLDYTQANFETHVQEATKDCTYDQERLIAWYLYVRDQWAYDPCTIYLEDEKYKASSICERKACHCIDKTILFMSGLRALGIPCRMHLAKVKNHISAERVIEKFGSDELAPHGYAGVYWNGNWTKASPIFDANLCRFLNVDTLEYDGTEDSIFQEFDKKGEQFMEYLEDYGAYDDVPMQRIKDIMAAEYPKYAAAAIESGAEVMKF